MISQIQPQDAFISYKHPIGSCGMFCRRMNNTTTVEFRCKLYWRLPKELKISKELDRERLYLKESTIGCIMASSSAPKMSSSVSTPPLALGSTEERFKAKLVALIDVAIGFVEGLHEASDKKISGIAEQDMDDLELNKWYLDTKTEPRFYAISYEHKKSSDEEIWDNTLPENLKLPALFTQQCSKIVYCLLPVIRDILGGMTIAVLPEKHY